MDVVEGICLLCMFIQAASCETKAVRAFFLHSTLPGFYTDRITYTHNKDTEIAKPEV